MQLLENRHAEASAFRRRGAGGRHFASIPATLNCHLSLASFAMALMLPTGGISVAAESDITPALRSRAISICTDDAMRLCPETLFDEGRVVTCMAQHRRQLSHACGVVYDQVARALRR